MKKKAYKAKPNKSSKVEEPLVAYGALSSSPLVVMAGHEFSEATDFDLLNLARKGVSKQSLVALAKKISLTLEELAVILHISERTLQRYTPTTLVKTEHVDRAIELALLYEQGIELFGNESAFDHWIRTPNLALNNEVPLSLLDTSIGFGVILQSLGRLEYGIFS